MVVLCCQTLLHKDIIATSMESFAVTDRSVKTVNLFHLERYSIYGISTMQFYASAEKEMHTRARLQQKQAW